MKRFILAAFLALTSALSGQARDTVMVPSVQITSVGGSPFRLIVNNVEVQGRTWASYHTAAVALDSAKKACSFCDVRIRQTLEWTSTIRSLPYVTLRATTPPPPPPADTTPTPPPPPPSGGTFIGWFSDWAAQTADQGHIYDNNGPALTRLLDSGKWSSAARYIHQEVVTAPVEAPFLKWVKFEFVAPNVNGGQSEIWVTTLPTLAPDVVQTWRWYESYDQPGNVGATNNHHDIGAKIPGGGELWTQDASYDVSDETRWVDFFAVPGEGGGANRKWGVWTNCNVSQGSNNCATQYRYTKGSLYMKVVQMRRLGSTQTFRLKVWTYSVGAGGALTLLHGPADYRNENGSLSLADNPTLNGNLSLTSSFTIGSNGISGTFPTPLPFMRIGGVAVIYGLPEGTPLGPYGRVQGEVPR